MQDDDELNALDDELDELEAQHLRLEGAKMRVRALETRLKALNCYEVKTLAFDVKALTEAGEFTGLAAAYHAVDQQNDSIAPGAFATSLQLRRTVPLLWSHDASQVLGVAELEDTPEGLRVHGRLNLLVARAKEIYELIRQGAVRGLSIGFSTVTAAWKGSTRILKEINLFEISLTSFPAQPLAIVTAVKSQGPEAADEAAMAAIVQTLAETRAWLRQRW